MKSPCVILFATLLACTTDYRFARAQAAPPGGVELPQEWSQQEMPWGGEKLLNHPSWLVKDKGCMLVAGAVLLRFYGLDLLASGDDLNPGTLNNFLRAHLPAGSQDFNWLTLASLANGGWFVPSTGIFQGPFEARQRRPGDGDFCCLNQPGAQCEATYLRHYLSARHPVHVRVNGRLTPSTCSGHSVIVTQHVKFPSSAVWQVSYSDPGKTIPQQGPENNFLWSQVRPWVPNSVPSAAGEIVFKTFVRDISGPKPVLTVGANQLVCSVLGTEQLLITDPLGRRLGTDSVGTAHAEIPGGTALTGDYNDLDPEDIEFAPEPSTVLVDETLETSHWIADPVPGDYEIRVWGDPTALISMTANGPSTSASRSFTGGAAAGRTYSYSLPADFGTTTPLPGDRVTLSQRLLVPLPPDGARIYIADTGLAAGLYSDHPTSPSSYLLDPTRGAIGMVTGEMIEVGGEREIQAAQLFSGRPAGTNQPPVASWDSATVAAGGILVLPASAVLANDTDPEMELLSVTAVGETPDTQGSVSLAGDEIRYVPDAGATGQTLFVYEVRDPSGNYGAAGVTVELVPTTGIDDGPATGVLLQSWPRPARDLLFVHYRLVTGGPAVLTLTDVAGRVVARRFVSGQGVHVEKFGEVARLAPGVYLLHLEQAGRVTTDRVVLVK